MVNVVLQVIPEPAEGTATVFVQGDEPPHAFFSSDGEVNHLCGGCKFKLTENVGGSQLSNIVLRCPRCQRFNITRV